MKTNCSYAMNPERTGALIPPQMLRAGSTCLRSIIDILILYGVSKIELGQTAYGSLLLLSPRVQTIPQLESEVPDWVLLGKKQAMYHLAQLMSLLGLFGVEVVLDEQEIAQVKQRWISCEAAGGDGSPAQLDPAQLQVPPPIPGNTELALPLQPGAPPLPAGPLLPVQPNNANEGAQ